MRKKEMFALCAKAYVGPGGWRCPCCAHHSVKWMRVHFNREVRRKVRVALKKKWK